MAHMVESMFSASRVVPWHGLGKVVEEALDSEEALIKAGLAWAVAKETIFVGGKEVEGYAATVRQTDRKILGIVGDRYRVVQNSEAFRWTDALLGEGVRYETAGSLREGRTVWLLAKMPIPFQIAGDDVEPYLVFTNSHDGTSSVRVALTPVRVVCNNTLSWALKGAKRTWAMAHTTNVYDRMAEARETLGLADLFMRKLVQEADELAQARVEIDELLEKLIPDPQEPSEAIKRNVQETRDEIYQMSLAPDITQFRGTAWGFMNAVSDYVTHREPKRASDTWQERRFENIIAGDKMLQQARALVRG